MVEKRKDPESSSPLQVFILAVMSTSKIVFKTYTPKQILLVPPSFDELIEPNHPVRIVDQVVDKLDLDLLIKKYKGGGTSSYHPRMLLKVLVYSYLNNIYSSRKMEEALKQNIHFMWLSGMNTPDHNTLNRFRSDKLKNVLKKIFSQVVMLLSEEGLVSLKTVFIDGTKIEANANKYTFVWGKAIQKSKERIAQQLEDLWSYTESIAAEELQDSTEITFEKIDAEKVTKTIAAIESALKDKPVDKKVTQKIKYAKKNWPANLERYEQQSEVLNNRNSFSKTDPDATFMRMKEDHMLNGQLKPGYNLQLSTNDQFILNYSLHPNTNDINTLKDHLSQHENLYNEFPEQAVADAGYGSEENYLLLEDKGIDAYVKYNYFDKEQKKKKKEDPFAIESLHYDSTQDRYYCPMGQPMERINDRKRITASGFVQHNKRYRATRCEGCPLRGMCFKGKYDRVIEINSNLIRLKNKARERLTSEVGIKLRKKRCYDVEPVFGHIKYNKKFKRFNLRGNLKVEVEIGLIAIAHNLKKKAA